ncbi:MAG: SusC/RagA family TonB-linked outer membrane protein, partial [Dysgonamonadaceae bacterium]|nr:SusC/RagA family TonB-linked outer membrane protein [Dysgonamonadaceae bacterium]
MLLRKRRWKTVFAALVLITLQNMCLWAQNNAKITGTVYDETQIPMVGVPITVKGSAEGTVTDINGNFEMTLSLSESTVLVCTYIGYNPKEVKLNGQNHLTITMTPAINTLDDVVVIGYGTQKRLSITGAVGTVSYKDLARTTATTTAATLAGKTPGITFRQTNGQPGQTMRMEIRNMGSPLFIIDGIMKDEGQFNNLDINDIENISILKDGSAAIYGVKAANGVVLVTTKRGSLNEKPTIKINAYYGIQNWTRFPKMSDAYNYSNAYAEASLTTTGENRTGLTHDNLAKYATGYYNPDTGEDYRSFDWYDFVVNKNAPQKYLNVSSQGGSEKLNYYFSISKIDQSANFYDFNFNRTNFQANMDAQISKQLKTGISMNGRLENRLSPSVGDNYNNDFWNLRWGLNRNKPTERPYANDNPDYLNATTNIINNQAYARRDIIGTGDDRWRVFQGNWNIEWTSPLKGLKAAFLYSYYAANLQIDRRKLETPFYHYDYMTQTYSETSGLTTKSLQKRQATIWENMYRFSLQYENKFGNHNLNAIVVAEATERFDRALTMYNGEISDNFQTLFPNSSDNSITEDYLNEYPS